MSVRIQLRRGSSRLPSETPLVGEPIWDPVNRRLGLFNGGSGDYLWYPIVASGEVRLNQGQIITGNASGNVPNHVVLDWDTPNELIVRNASTGTILARFTETGVNLHNPIISASAEIGISNRFLNGNLSVIRSSIAPVLPVTTANPTYRSYAIAPNWHLWRQAATLGDISVDYDSVDLPYMDISRVFNINTTTGVTSGGLRTFIHSYNELRGKTISVGGSYKLAAGQTCFIRVVSDVGAIGVPYAINGTGGWTDEYAAFSIPVLSGAQWIAFDMVYRPNYMSATSQNMKAGRFFCNIGSVPHRYESRNIDMERGLMSSIFREGVTYANGQAFAPIDLNFSTIPDLNVQSAAGNVVINGLTKAGAAVNVPSAPASGLTTINYAALSIIRTAETA